MSTSYPIFLQLQLCGQYLLKTYTVYFVGFNFAILVNF